MKAGARLGFDRFDDSSKDVSEEDRRKQMYSDVMIEVERHFRPEFLNRLDESIVFNPLTHEDLSKIVHLQLSEVMSRLSEKGVELDLSDSAVDFLIEKGHTTDYGARPLRRAIERHIEDPLAEHILRSTFVDGVTIQVEVAEDKESLSFTQDRSKAKPVEAGAASED
jgi:ATP-dependent Clp protease ATP-binding subunit ClpC